MIDIHCHVLYGVDDGAEDFIDSKEMLRIAAEGGITDVIATPHCYPGMYDNFNGRTLTARFDSLNRRIGEIGSSVRVHSGMEVYADDDTLRRMDSGRLMTLAGSRYMLIECAFNENPRFMTHVLRGLRERGVHPIIAHPERYYFINDRMDTALEWVDMGCSLQLNAGSLTGYFGRESRESAYALLAMGAVQFVASDAHGAIKRTPELIEAYEQVGVHTSFRCAELLFKDNPAHILADEALEFVDLDSEFVKYERFMSDEDYWNSL